MNKICALFVAFLTLVGCSQESVDLKGKNFKTVDADTKLEITLNFDAKENRFYGKAVNNYFGSYEQKESSIKFSQVGSTMMAAPEPLMKAESAYFALLPTINSFSLKGKNLILSTQDGKKISFDEYTPAPVDNAQQIQLWHCLMSETKPLEPMNEFFPLLVESFVRLESIVTCLKNEDAGNDYVALPTKFKIAKQYFEQLRDCDIQSSFLGINLDYDESNEILTATPDEFVLELYKNKIMREVALKQDIDFQVRYSKFITVLK